MKAISVCCGSYLKPYSMLACQGQLEQGVMNTTWARNGVENNKMIECKSIKFRCSQLIDFMCSDKSHSSTSTIRRYKQGHHDSNTNDPSCGVETSISRRAREIT